MATAGTSGQSTFGLGRKKKAPGLMDQISKFFGGDKKKRSKGSFRGHLASSPQQSSSRRRTNENAVVHFFRSIVSSPRPKSRWRDVLGLSDSLLLDDFETARLFMNHNRPRPRAPKAQSRRSEDAKTKAHCPDSSTWETPSPAHPPNAGAPSSELSAEDQTTDPTPMGQEEEGGGGGGGGGGTDLQVVDSQPQEMLTN
ncbi:myelin basic protein isoform X2 [Labrus mixtus]|uniref:myelin basic protein isoform X2 n=1 Tax=Labrus mixtus TaxID=508554 RepID=UPI0029BFFFD4|nr:myelin basic protein isoform X2 [Labrus mixtus]